MKKSTAIFAFALLFLLQLGISISAQESGESDPFLQPRLAKLDSSLARNSEPSLVDVGVEFESPSISEEETPIKFDDAPIPENLEEKQAEVQGKILIDTLRLIGFAALLLCAAIAGLVFYGRHNDSSRGKRRRRRHDAWN
jgi:hypothetical protein